MSMFHRALLVAALILVQFPLGGADRKYSGPYPPKPDVPYLMHADNLVATEALEAKQEVRGRETVAWVPGISSPVRTPLAEPIFLIDSQKLAPEKFELYRLEVKRDRREVVFSKKQSKGAGRPIRIMVKALQGKLYRIEANETLANGEYALSPSGSDAVFCFQVY
jgi:hypothetical protein